ncbi:MAG TPA: tetratricopeptide repeat protein [Gemmatimonadaceae bacterium]|nr:tetratricopeptide repeat protein [Gemmatimonadaceae bacterium]
MTEVRSVRGIPAAPTGTLTFLMTSGAVLASIAALLVFDLWLARIDARESRLQASHLFEDGRTLLARGRTTQAVDRFASAQALERHNVRYGVALAEALLANGRANEAEAQLRGVLGRAETDGPANLVMARVLAREGMPDEAKAFYHRAIYGNWSADSSGQRLHARLELIDLLVRRDAKQELLAELLPLQETDTGSVELRRRLGHLFILAGSPGRALPLFRALLRRDSDDGDAYAGMGEAALLMGNFRTARADLTLATRLLPDSGRYAAVIQVADTALALDPTARGISRSTRYARSRAILQLTIDAACEQSAAIRQLSDSARLLMTAPPDTSRSESTEEADRLLDLGSALWAKVESRCGIGNSPVARAVALIQEKLS